MREHLLERIAAAVEERAAAGLPQAVEERLAAVPNAFAGAEALARRGYLTRVVETELFTAAREPPPWPAASPEAIAEAAAGLAAAEPPGRPAPDDERAATWRVPGPGGHVRHYLALAAARRLAPDVSPEAAKRAWLYGFFSRCCEERPGFRPPA